MRCGYGMAGGYLTNVMLHSLKNYFQERPTELRRLSKDTRSSVWCCDVTFPQSFVSVVVLTCGSCELEQRKS